MTKIEKEIKKLEKHLEDYMNGKLSDKQMDRILRTYGQLERRQRNTLKYSAQEYKRVFIDKTE